MRILQPLFSFFTLQIREEVHVADAYNVYTQDAGSDRPVRIAELVSFSNASELVRKFSRSGYSGDCYLIDAKNDPNYFYEED